MKRQTKRLRYVALMACWATIGMASGVKAAPSERRPASLGMLVERLAESTNSVIAAERVATAEVASTASSLAQQLVAAQLAIAEQNYERAAIHSLDLAENHPDTAAGRQAIYYLGVALMHLDMERWAVEQFTRVLRDMSPEARRFHQRSVARLFDLAVPRRPRGFARQPGLSAMPELRSRLESVGIDVHPDLVRGVVSKNDAEKLERWAKSFPEESREVDLRYAYGRYLYLVGRPAEAQVEMDALNPLDIPMSRGGENARWRVRAAYVAAASSAAMGDLEDALLRFQLITQARPQDDADRQIVELSRMAVARIHQDRQEYEESLSAYRGMGRDSPLFKEALYESAWALLGAKRFDQAIDVLDQLLAYGEHSSVGIEIKQLRGKVKIQARDYPAAEEEFLALRATFEAALHKLAPRLTHRADASAYFASVVGHEMEHFSLETLLPPDAAAIAERLPVAIAGRDLAREAGALEREILEIRALLAEMEAAVAAPEKARLFNDLGAQAAALDHVELELLDVREALLLHLASASERLSSGAERQRKAMRERVDHPVLEHGLSRTRIVAWLNHINEHLADADRSIAASRAELVGLEFQFSARVDQLGEESQRTFFSEARALRDHIAQLESAAAGMRSSIRQTQMRLRFDDPQRGATRQARKEYQAALLQMFQAQARNSKAADVQTVWRRVDELAIRCEEARAQLEVAAEARLAGAREVLLEERENLDTYLDEMKRHRASVRQSVGEVLSAVFRDVVVELKSLVMRSEVGFLDVAWAMKEAEAGEATRLEKARDSDLRELDRSVELGLEAAGP